MVRHHVDRSPMARMRAGSAVLATVLLLFVATWGSYGTDPLSEAIGSAVASESILFGSLGETTRGHTDPALETRREQIRTALGLIDEARTSMLGFHTGYQPGPLEEAAHLIKLAALSTSPVEPTPTELFRLHDEILDVLGSPAALVDPNSDLVDPDPDLVGHPVR